MFNRLPKDRTLEMDRLKDIKKYNPPVPHLLQAQQTIALALLYAKVVELPGTGSHPGEKNVFHILNIS